MKVGAQTLPLALEGESLDSILEFFESVGIESVEPNCAREFATPLVPPSEYLDDGTAQSALLETLEGHGMDICSLGAKNNTLHPDEEQAARADRELRDVIRLADQLGVNTVSAFSGLPAGGPNDEVPNWTTSPFPPGTDEVYEYQWEDVAIPYWQDLAAFADDHDTDVAIEIHYNMLVHEPTGLVRLREETNERIGADVDPSHLYFQGIDVRETIRYLGERNAIHHFEASDANLQEPVSKLKGVLDPTPPANRRDRSWVFSTVGYGHDEKHWRDVVGDLRTMGYDGALSIQQLNTGTDVRTGIEKSAKVLHEII